MITEVTGDLFTWTPPAKDGVTPIVRRVITTNGSVKRNGEAVMGRGCALEAATRWPSLPFILGQDIANWGLRVTILNTGRYNLPVKTKAAFPNIDLMVFPVKYQWRETAHLGLIFESMEAVIARMGHWGTDSGSTLVMPKPGCGNGHLSWDKVKPVLCDAITKGNQTLVRNGYRAVKEDRIYVIDRP